MRVGEVGCGWEWWIEDNGVEWVWCGLVTWVRFVGRRLVGVEGVGDRLLEKN